MEEDHHPGRKLSRKLLSCLYRSPSSYSSPISFVRQISYKDIKRATDGFHRLIYSNSRGAAYKARFQDGSLALVKEIRVFEQEKDVFYSEVQLLGRLHHRHLLSLRGISVGHKRLLVFDNIDNGSLKEHLNDPLKTPLNWKTRLQIASGVAAALEYLLLFSASPMCHFSVNSSNIMLDENFTAKLSDVGCLSSVSTHAEMPHCSSVEVNPSSKQSGRIIYELGILILELVTGQSSDQEDSDLVQWISGSRFGSSVHNMIDPDLGDNYDSRELKNLLTVARLCIKSGDKPPFSVAQIFRYLQKKISIPCN